VQHFALALGEGVEHLLDLLMKQVPGCGLLGVGKLPVLDEVAELTVFLLADGRFEGDGELRDPAYLLHFDRLDLHLGGDLVVGRLAPQALNELAGDADHLVDGLHHVDGDADGARLVGDRPGDGLANPPCGVGAELEPLAVVELLHRADQAEVPLLDEVEEEHSAPDVLLGDAHHKAQVGVDDLLLR